MGGKEIIVLGLGNPLMGDEGVGLRVVEEASKLAGENSEVEFLDAGTGGISVLHHIADRKKAIIVDCAFMNETPGTIRRFLPDDVVSVKTLAHQSLHEADIIKVIGLAKQLGQCPDEVVFFGIEPKTVEPIQGLSEPLEQHIKEYIHAILEELSR